MTQGHLFAKTEPQSALGIVPRPYQDEALEASFELWDSGTVGVLLRAATGTGKTIMACMLADRWLQRGSNHRVMVISYEKQLVWQFGEEIEDVLRLTPGIEMEREEIEPGMIPKITVASRQTLMRQPLATEKQVEALAAKHIEVGEALVTKDAAKKYLRLLSQGGEPELIRDDIAEFQANYRCDHVQRAVSRMHKFDHNFNWLVVYDEAHKHTHQLTTVGHIVDWFDRNSNSRRCGMTATPKRSDGVSIGDKMFPGIAIDYPLYSQSGKCSVKDGWSVPYVQKYIEVSAVDFKAIKQASGNSLSKWDNNVAMVLEKELATLCEPMLDLVGNRRTLIFSPSVQIAKDVADYVNARRPVQCECGAHQWIAKCIIGDGGTCKTCNRLLHDDDITWDTPLAASVDGSMSPEARKEVYSWHQSGQGQFLSVCGLCREGYNDREIGAVAIFRPVSKAASSLAEQMKGRGSRPLKGLVDGVDTVEDRLQAIAQSSKPDCLIVDLVGCTGLGDCATTVQIYAEGLPDEVIERAEKIASEGEENVEVAIERAEQEIADEKERIKREREQRAQEARELAERRAAARATAEYTVHDVGYAQDSRLATSSQLKYLHFLGLDIMGWEPTKRQAGKMITQLKEEKLSPAEVADYHGLLDDDWAQATATDKQKKFLRWKNCPVGDDCTPAEASRMIQAIKEGRNPQPTAPSHVTKYMQRIQGAATSADLDAIGRDMMTMRRAGYWTDTQWGQLVEAGKRKRSEVRGG